MVIRLGVTGLKKTGFVCFQYMFGGRGREGVVGWGDLMCVIFKKCWFIYVIYIMFQQFIISSALNISLKNLIYDFRFLVLGSEVS